MTLALVRDLREHRVPASAEELAGFETDVLAGFVLARASAGLADSTIRNDTGHLELIRGWFGRPLWEMQPCGCRLFIRAGQAACWYSWRVPPSRSRLRTSSCAIRSRSAIGSGSGRRGAAARRVRWGRCSL